MCCPSSSQYCPGAALIGSTLMETPPAISLSCAFLVSKSLAAYEFNSKKREMEIAIKIDKWEHYLCNKRYGLLSPQNAEVTITRIDMENFLCGKKQQDNKQYDHCLIRFGKKDSKSCASKISQQEILLQIIPEWRSKQCYFRRNTNKQVMYTLLDNKEVFNRNTGMGIHIYTNFLMSFIEGLLYP